MLLGFHIVKIYSSQLGTYKGQTFEVKKTEINKKDARPFKVSKNIYVKLEYTSMKLPKFLCKTFCKIF